MVNGLDLLDVRILEHIDRYGPRNVSSIARKLGVPIETTRKRVKRLTSRFSTEFLANIYHTNLGLKKAFVFADAAPGYEDVLLECLKTNDFWLYVGRYYGRCEGCYGIYAFPVGHTQEFEEFAHCLERMEIGRNVRVMYSTCLHTVNMGKEWFDSDSQTWTFSWNKWIEEIPSEGTELPRTLVDPEDFPIKADYTDILILAELEVNSTASFHEIARVLNMTSESVAYHYKNHILRRGLLEKSQIFLLRFDKAISDFSVFILRFDDRDKMAQVALSLLDKPFVHTMGKILGENALIFHMFLPRNEFRSFVYSLSELVRMGILQTYEYMIEDFNKRASQTISFEYFKETSWVYDHEKHIENLRNILRDVGLEEHDQKKGSNLLALERHKHNSKANLV
jgi:DNA-binding Lrp family transcriptional regulator